MAHQRIEIGSSTIFRLIVILLAVWFLYFIRDIAVMLFVAFIIASAFEPIVNWLQRYRFPRIFSVLIVYVTVLSVFGVFLALMAEPLATQAYQFAQAVPGLIVEAQKLIPLLPVIDHTTVVQAFQQFFQSFGRDAANIGLNLFQGTRTVFSLLFSIVFMIVLSFYLTLEQNAFKKFARLVTPASHLPYVEKAISRAQRGVGRWVLGLIALGTVVGALIGIGLWIIGVPYALLLAILAGLMEALPIIGPVIAGVVGVTVALSQSLVVALIAIGLYVIVGSVESHVLIPAIMRRAVGLKPVVTIIAVLIGARMGGIIGVILAVPATTVLMSILSDIFQRSDRDTDLAS